MAVGLDVVEKNLEDLETEITCAVCQEHYTDPKILPCLHCYCKQCILKLTLRVGKGKPFPCPECRKDTVLPEEGEEGLKSAFIINRLKSMYLKHKNALSKKVHCEICTNTEAVAEAFCHQCDKFACKSCVYQHTLMKAVFEGHECVPIEQLQNIRSEKLEPKSPDIRKCDLHKKKLKLYCFKCNKLICRDCTVIDHRDHNIEFNNVAADKKKTELMEALKPLREIEESLSEDLTKVATAESEIQVQEKAAINKIETSFEELHEILEINRKQLLENVSMVTNRINKKLTEQKKKMSDATREVHSVIDHTEQCVRLCSDNEVMSMHSEVTGRIQTQIRECRVRETDREVLEKADITVSVDIARSLQQLCQDNAVINTSLIEKFELEKISPAMEVDKELKFEISSKSDEVISARNIKCQFQCISTGAVSTAKIEESGVNKFEVTYTPTQRGRYALEIKAYSHSVPDTLLVMTASLSPTKLTKPLKSCKNITNPLSIAINSHCELPLVEYNRAIKILNKEGNTIRTIDIKSLLVDSLRSLTVDHEDNIYYVGFFTSKLGKCDRYLNNIKVQDVQQVQGCGHYCIAVVGERVLVTERDNKGQIVEYNKDLNFVRYISTGMKTTLRHLCPDSHGKLYVTTGDKTIVVININGNILRSFSQDQKEVQILKDPWMVHVYGHYVYVADHGLKKTVVFTTDSQYVITLGHYGPLCIDEDGVVYYCDHYNDCMHIY